MRYIIVSFVLLFYGYGIVADETFTLLDSPIRSNYLDSIATNCKGNTDEYGKIRYPYYCMLNNDERLVSTDKLEKAWPRFYEKYGETISAARSYGFTISEFNVTSSEVTQPMDFYINKEAIYGCFDKVRDIDLDAYAQISRRLKSSKDQLLLNDRYSFWLFSEESREDETDILETKEETFLRTCIFSVLSKSDNARYINIFNDDSNRLVLNYFWHMKENDLAYQTLLHFYQMFKVKLVDNTNQKIIEDFLYKYKIRPIDQHTGNALEFIPSPVPAAYDKGLYDMAEITYQQGVIGDDPAMRERFIEIYGEEEDIDITIAFYVFEIFTESESAAGWYRMGEIWRDILSKKFAQDDFEANLISAYFFEEAYQRGIDCLDQAQFYYDKIYQELTKEKELPN